MCGFAGLWRNGTSADVACAAGSMAATLAHRGPDASGVWADEAAGLGLGHTRLAVLDLSPAGNQPMQSASGRHVLVYNGEIYNHLDIRAELEASARFSCWRGHSDTETLLAAIETWGLEAALQRIVGMFALAVWDRKERRLQLARDRAGEKPLYYGWVGGAFAFASELKALRQVPGFDNPVDRDALALYARFTAVPAPRSIYKDICKLPPGTTLTVSADDIAGRRQPEPSPYWSVADAAGAGVAEPIGDEATACATLESVLRLAVAGQMIADVPLGAFLSGGVDSSTIVALMQVQSPRPIRTFTVGFDESGYDEAPFAAAVARHLGTEHHELRVSPADARDVIPSLPDLYDEPFADSSQIPTHLICKAARSNITVAISGDGGDELFGGYDRYTWGSRIWRRLGWLPFPARQLLGRTLLAVPSRVWDGLGAAFPSVARHGDKAHKLGACLRMARDANGLYRGLVTEWSADERIVLGAGRPLSRLDEPELSAGIAEPSQRMMLMDMLTYLPDDILTKVDRAAMGISLETRAPFLNHRVIELAWRLPLSMKIRGSQNKWALRRLLYKYVPRELIERPKAGFAIPVGPWLRGPLRDWAESLISESLLRQQGFFDPKPIHTRWQDHLSGRRDWTPSLWAVLMFQSWLERHRAA